MLKKYHYAGYLKDDIILACIARVESGRVVVLKEITSELGVSNAAMYYYFSSYRDVLPSAIEYAKKNGNMGFIYDVVLKNYLPLGRWLECFNPNKKEDKAIISGLKEFF